MKIRLTIIFFLVTASVSLAQPNTLVLEGNYLGKNIYIQNPFNESGDGFCTVEVRVNGIKMLQSTNSSAYVIPLDSFNFKLYDSVRIVITHENNCTPKVLNTEHGPTNPTFVIDTISVDSTGLLKWSTKEENGKLMYSIEQFIWNKWMVVGEMGGTGLVKGNHYEFKLSPHSGENKIRVKQVDRNGNARVSTQVSFISKIPEVRILSYRVNEKIEFSANTRYEIYDEYGNMVDRGYKKEVNCSKLKNGAYYVNFDNSEKQIFVNHKK